MRINDRKVIEFNEQTDDPEAMRRAVVAWIDETVFVTAEFLAAAFCPYSRAEIAAGVGGLDMPPRSATADYTERIGEKTNGAINRFCEQNEIVLVAHPSGLFQFMRATRLDGLQFKTEAVAPRVFRSITFEPKPYTTADLLALKTKFFRFLETGDSTPLNLSTYGFVYIALNLISMLEQKGDTMKESPILEPPAVGATPANMRQAIVERIDEKPSVRLAYIEKAFAPGEPPPAAPGRLEQITEIGARRSISEIEAAAGEISAFSPSSVIERVERFLKENRFAFIALPTGLFQFLRVEAVGIVKSADDCALLENFWSGVELTVRTQKFAVVKSDLLRGLHFNATGEELLSVSTLSEISKKRGFSVVLRRRENKLTFRRFVKLDDSGNVDRASGEARCSACSQILYDHPESEDAASVRIDCDGRGWHI